MTILLTLLQGAPLTLLLWISAQIVGGVIGIPVAAARMHRGRWLRWVATCWIELFRGIPTLVWLFIVYFGLSLAGINLTSIVAAITALGLISSAYLAETYRSGFETVPRHQYEAALALSLSVRPRMVRVILPQALPVIIEGAASYSIHLLKETALASLIGVIEVMSIANYQVERAGGGTVVFFLTGMIYLAGCLVLAGLSQLFSRRFSAAGRKARTA